MNDPLVGEIKKYSLIFTIYLSAVVSKMIYISPLHTSYLKRVQFSFSGREPPLLLPGVLPFTSLEA